MHHKQQSSPCPRRRSKSVLSYLPDPPSNYVKFSSIPKRCSLPSSAPNHRIPYMIPTCTKARISSNESNEIVHTCFEHLSLYPAKAIDPHFTSPYPVKPPLPLYMEDPHSPISPHLYPIPSSMARFYSPFPPNPASSSTPKMTSLSK